MSPPNIHNRRQRRILIGVALLFFAPLGLSFYLYYARDWHPGGRVNAGELIQPPRPLPALALPLLGGGEARPQLLKGKWTLLYVQHGRCDDECGKRLYDTRQVRLALDREMNRVQRVFIGDDDCCDLKQLQAAHPDLIVIRASAADEPLIALLPAPAGAGAFNAQRVYLTDPLANVMMFYESGSKPKGMLEDLKRLLRLSSIG
jgi:cytochrome oxidase Cu insertion factor (SCO1/SenC/PrrC family)